MNIWLATLFLSSSNWDWDSSFNNSSLYHSLWYRNWVSNIISLYISILNIINSLVVIIFVYNSLSVVVSSRYIYVFYSRSTSLNRSLNNWINHLKVIFSLIHVKFIFHLMNSWLIVFFGVNLLSWNIKSFSSFSYFLNWIILSIRKSLSYGWQFSQMDLLVVVNNLFVLNWLNNSFFSRSFKYLLIVSGLYFFLSNNWFIFNILSISSIYLNNFLNGVFGWLN